MARSPVIAAPVSHRQAVLHPSSQQLKEARKSIRALGKSKRHKYDFYATGRRAVADLRNRLKISGCVVEVCNGLGAISSQFPDCRIVTNDIDPMKPADSHVDAAVYVYPPDSTCVTNPPFNEAFKILVNARSQNVPCAFLLRLSFVEPTEERCVWLHASPPDGIIVLQRYSFTGDGHTDSVTAAWFLWGLKMEPAIQIAERVS